MRVHDMDERGAEVLPQRKSGSMAVIFTFLDSFLHVCAKNLLSFRGHCNCRNCRLLFTLSLAQAGPERVASFACRRKPRVVCMVAHASPHSRWSHLRRVRRRLRFCGGALALVRRGRQANGLGCGRFPGGAHGNGYYHVRPKTWVTEQGALTGSIISTPGILRVSMTFG